MHAEKCTLLLASLSLPSAHQLAVIAKERGWRVHALDEYPDVSVTGDRTFYGGSDRAAEYATRFDLALFEPLLDLLARVPLDLRLRDIRFCTLRELSRLQGPLFVKPADPIAKVFDAGVYRRLDDLLARGLDRETPVLVSEPIEWTSEFRCFVCDGQVVAWSPYLSFGRPVWKPQSAGRLPASLKSFCGRLIERMGDALPPAFVVDIGVVDDGGWAVVEFNPAWCSGILGADVEGALIAIRRSARWAMRSTAADRRWIRL